MKVKELAEVCRCPVMVKSGYNEKVLCRQFDKKKHIEIGERVITSVWTEIKVTSGFANIASSLICVYVEGSEEFEKGWKNK